MPNDESKGTGEPGWTEEEKGQGAPTLGNADAGNTAGEAVPKSGYGGDDRAATEAVAARVKEDSKGKANPEDREQ
ncbi:hypothetical protein GCM10011504_50900 [Siccirubricoccus deserti]|uniref:Uncharacterized protein n=1 Tax=Siccirubricoccus deserti TaxID=2013562 RepID=A0A9X0R2V2_9PROT|nr:hypothetical protein [Siccirubricoccus deserti]MBC4018556.1 hypothetical protein [Siccirubricoccus deserti]GGC66738.1 hypothetical protein GCM10011504_50900 [Siccirubricoccus deserti]